MQAWEKELSKKMKFRDEFADLREGLRVLSKIKVPAHREVLAEAPFDAHLLKISSLYRRSRHLYAQLGGEFRSTLVTSERTLSSPILLEPMIEYSPTQREWIWAAQNISGKDLQERTFELRTFTASLFHEQNHRVLWKLLPSVSKKKGQLRKFLNFAEALVLTLDVALGDELGSDLARFFYLAGAIYNPGSEIKKEKISKREYRNFLQAHLHASYLILELLDPADVKKVVRNHRAVERAAKIDQKFIINTNLVWQWKHEKLALKKLGSKKGAELELPDDPFDNRLQYLFLENYLDQMGL